MTVATSLRPGNEDFDEMVCSQIRQIEKRHPGGSLWTLWWEAQEIRLDAKRKGREKPYMVAVEHYYFGKLVSPVANPFGWEWLANVEDVVWNGIQKIVGVFTDPGPRGGNDSLIHAWGSLGLKDGDHSCKCPE